METAITVALVALGLWLLHRFLTYAEARGWIYYRRKRGTYGGLHTTTNFLNMYDPSRRHLQEVVREGDGGPVERFRGPRGQRQELERARRPGRWRARAARGSRCTS